jgi:glycosyltransferase involved in cell wall biosynthesis
VLHVLFSFNIGGIERLITDTLEPSLKREFRYGVAIINNSMNSGLVGAIEDAGHYVTRLGRRQGSGTLRTLYKFALALSMHRPRLLHVHEGSLIPLAFAASLMRPELKLVFSAHNLGVADLHSWQVTLLNKAFAGVVAVSDSVRSAMLDNGVKHVDVIHNGVDLSRFSGATRPGPCPSLRVLCVGRFDFAVKGQDILLQALARCVSNGDDVTCTFVGNADGRNEQDLRDLKALALRLAISDRVEFVTGRADVEHFHSLSDVLVVPSRSEAFGLVAVEAMASGLPVIAANVGGLPHIVQDGRNGILFRCGDAEDLGKQLGWACRNRERLSQIGEAGRGSSSNYSISHHVAEVERLYSKVISAKRLPWRG